MTWETIIGLEVHVQLLTRSKMFCGCSAKFGDAPNTNVCPVCLGMPGALPVPNEQAVRLAVRAAYALACAVHSRSLFARKNYFYPDLPKGYQISQFEEPLAAGGGLEIVSPARGVITVGITRLHLEEDAAKSFHDRVPGMTAVDFNRSGVPLIEIVSEPDLRSPAEARAYLVALKQVLRYLEVSDCNMEEGSLRVDANVSVRRPGAPLGTRTEVKNMNSFSGVERALTIERDRQVAAVERGEKIEQRTMLYDAATNEVRPMRSKEESDDYRYFPEPDLPPLVLSAERLAAWRAEVGELPAHKRDRFIRSYQLSEYDATVLAGERELADYYEAIVRRVVAAGADAKEAANWVINDALAFRAEHPGGRLIPESTLADGVRLVREGKLSRQAAKHAVKETARRALQPASEHAMPSSAAAEQLTTPSMSRTPRTEEVARELGLIQVQDTNQIETWVRATLEAHASEVARYQSGETKLMGFFVGQVMKRSKGKADPKAVNAALTSALQGTSATG